MTVKKLDRASGSLQDIVRLNTLSDEVCNVLLVSDRTLYLLANYAINEVNWYSRYYTDIEGVFYKTVNPVGSNGELVDSIANNYNLEVIPVGTLDGVIDAINSVASAILASACGCPVGEGADNDSGAQGGDVPGDIGTIEYSEPDPIDERKCKASNWLFDGYLNIVTILDDNNIDDLSTGILSVVVTLVSGLIGAAVAGPFGAIIGAVGGAVLGITVAVTADGADLLGLKTALTANHEDLVCSLYQSGTAEAARSAFLQVLDDAGQTAVNLAIMEAMMPNGIINVLFFGANVGTENELLNYPSTIDCADCVDNCDLFFQLNTAQLPRGTGSLVVNGLPRLINSTYDAIADLHYIAIGVGDIGESNYSSDCDDMPAGCEGTEGEHFDAKWISGSQDIIDNNYGACDNGGHSSGVFTENTTLQVSWFELIGTAAFSATITLTD